MAATAERLSELVPRTSGSSVLPKLSILERKVIPYRHLPFLFVTTFDSFHGSEA